MGDRSVNRLGQRAQQYPDARVAHIECAGDKAMEKARLISQGECETHIHKQPREGTPDRIIRGFRLSGVAWRFQFVPVFCFPL
jgi:hypothetical protein